MIKITYKDLKSKTKLKSMEIASLITKIRLKKVKNRGRLIVPPGSSYLEIDLPRKIFDIF